jgi:hypothetical protein
MGRCLQCLRYCPSRDARRICDVFEARSGRIARVGRVLLNGVQPAHTALANERPRAARWLTCCPCAWPLTSNVPRAIDQTIGRFICYLPQAGRPPIGSSPLSALCNAPRRASVIRPHSRRSANPVAGLRPVTRAGNDFSCQCGEAAETVLTKQSGSRTVSSDRQRW